MLLCIEVYVVKKNLMSAESHQLRRLRHSPSFVHGSLGGLLPAPGSACRFMLSGLSCKGLQVQKSV